MENFPPEIESEAAEPKPTSWVRFGLDILEILLLSAVLFLVINTITARVLVDGYSMNPTLDNGEFILVNRLAYKFDSPHYGDIIVFHNPKNPSQNLIKRVIGLPGDVVRVQGGDVFVNDAKLSEPYIAAAPLYNVEWVVPEESFFVLGDNRNNSNDSHEWGTLPFQNIMGKAVLVYWPFDKINLIDHTEIVMAAAK